MAGRPLRPCNQPGCPQLIVPPERYCDVHRWTEEQRERERQRWYDERQRNRQAQAFYRSPAWKAFRLEILERDNHLCQRCRRHHRITKANTVHHLVPILVDWERRLDGTNVESICSSCHAQAEAESRGRLGSRGQGYGEA